MSGKRLQSALLLAAVLATLGAPTAEAGCVRPEHVVYSDASQNTAIDVAMATKSIVFTTRDGRGLKADQVEITDDGRRLSADITQANLSISLRADLALGRVRARATEIQLVPDTKPPGKFTTIRRRSKVKVWTLVSYGGPSQEGTCGRVGKPAAKAQPG